MSGLLRFLTAGESHGEALVAVIDGIPAGLPLTEGHINEVHILSGVRWRSTLGGPITLQIPNRDWENWKATMSVGPPEPGTAQKQVTRPRPGHADLAGAFLEKFGGDSLEEIRRNYDAYLASLKTW
jgi:chorismate synthase